MKTAFLGVALIVVACGGTPSPASEPAASCEELASSARTEVSAAIEANLACTTDADCKSFPFSAACFDSCERAVDVAGAAKVDDARTRVNGSQCQKFAAQGCKTTIPPCAPPMPVACVQGQCQ